MIFRVFVLIFFFIFPFKVESVDTSELELLDRIESEVTYLNSDIIESQIITKREVERRGFDGSTPTVDGLEDEKLADQFSKILKANITNDDINRNLKKNGMTEKDVCEIADRWGYLDKDAFFDDLKTIYRANAALGFQVESRLVASGNEINQYYKDHICEYKEEAKYIIETAFVPYPTTGPVANDLDDKEKINTLDKAKENLKRELEKYTESKIPKPNYINWDLPVTITQDFITEENEFLVNLAIGSMCMQEANNGFVLYKMKDKISEKTLPLEKVKPDIVMQLKKLKHPEIINEVKAKLRSQAIIVRPPELEKICNLK